MQSLVKQSSVVGRQSSANLAFVLLTTEDRRLTTALLYFRSFRVVVEVEA